MEDALRSFDKRQRALRRKHHRMARGYVTKLDRGGLIKQTPDNKLGGRLFRILILLAVCAFGFKVLLLAGLGEEDYAQRVAALEAGNSYEQAGAWVMQIDPVSKALADYAGPLVKDGDVTALLKLVPGTAEEE